MVCIIFQQYIIYKKALNRFPDIMHNNVRLNKKEKKELWKNVYGLSINKFAGAILSSIDNIVISTFISTKIVGIYSNYTMILAAATGIISMAFTSITANIGRKFADKSIKEEHFYMMFYINFLVCGICTILYYLLINDFIVIFYGKNLILGNDAIFAITLNMFITHMMQAIQVFKDASGIFWYGKYRPLFTCILNVFFSLILVKSHGIAGVVFATALSRIFTTVWFDPYLVFRHAFNKNTKKYWMKYFYYVFIIVISLIVTHFTIKLLGIYSESIVGFVLKSTVSILLSPIVMVLGTIWLKESKNIFSMVIKRINIH